MTTLHADVHATLQGLCTTVLNLPLPYTSADELTKATVSVCGDVITMRFTLADREPVTLSHKALGIHDRFITLMCLRDFSKDLYNFNHESDYGWIYEGGKCSSVILFA